MAYPGGKGKSFPHIINLMPPHRVYVEGFLGSGAVLRNKRLADRTIGIEMDPVALRRWKSLLPAGCEIVEGDALAVIPQLGLEWEDLVYLDPPYHPDTRRKKTVYRHEYSDADHQALLSLITQLPCKVMLSGYRGELYDTALKNWRRHDFMAQTHNGRRLESIWLNFDPPRQLHDSRYIGSTFRERQDVKRRLGRIQKRLGQLSPVERAEIFKWMSQELTP